MDRCGGFQKIPRLGRLSHDHNEPRATVEGAATCTGVGKSVFTCGSRKKGRRKAVMGSRVDLWRWLTYGTLAVCMVFVSPVRRGIDPVGFSYNF